jgi:hypothetical protein
VKKYYFAGQAVNPVESKINNFLSIPMNQLELIKSCIIMNNNSRLEMACSE